MSTFVKHHSAVALEALTVCNCRGYCQTFSPVWAINFGVCLQI